MLSPDVRTVAIDLLRPPTGYRLDHAVLTTFSLDLEALLALPLAALTHTDGGLEELLTDPMLLTVSLREAGERIHVFVDAAGIAIPQGARPLYSLLESSVHPVRAPNGGAFHPKVWVARFVDDEDGVLLRVAILSRNLTYDRCWDVALASEGAPTGKRRHSASKALGELLRALPEMAEHDLPAELGTFLETLTDEAERTLFPSPEGFEDAIAFQALGLKSVSRKPWRPLDDGLNLLAVAPFANQTALDALQDISRGPCALISRQETLDALPEGALTGWDPVLVLSEAAEDEVQDAAQRPSGLHAKIIGVEHGWKVTWFVGSANLTAAAFTGRNVEMMASVTGSKTGQRGLGIEKFQEGFSKLCEPYRRLQRAPDAALEEARSRLEEARSQLTESEMRVSCAPSEDAWSWRLEGACELPEGVAVHAWPVTVVEEQARELALPSRWNLPLTRLTAFVAFRLSVPGAGIDDVRLTLKLPTDGIPEGRLVQVLHTLIDSPERFLQFLRALLGGLEGLVEEVTGDASGSDGKGWSAGLGGETLLEDLVRVAARAPAKLEPVRRLITDLRKTEQGRALVPDELMAIWSVVDQALQPREAP